jgi:hypothetical protein
MGEKGVNPFKLLLVGVSLLGLLAGFLAPELGYPAVRPSSLRSSGARRCRFPMWSQVR